MNLLSNEQTLELINQARVSSDPDVLPAAIRQIQANAFRTVVEIYRDGRAARINIKKTHQAIEHLANQLDPQPIAPACSIPCPNGSGRTCDKPNGHPGEHWTYGSDTKTWTQPPTP